MGKPDLIRTVSLSTSFGVLSTPQGCSPVHLPNPLAVLRRAKE